MGSGETFYFVYELLKLLPPPPLLLVNPRVVHVLYGVFELPYSISVLIDNCPRSALVSVMGSVPLLLREAMP